MQIDGTKNLPRDIDSNINTDDLSYEERRLHCAKQQFVDGKGISTYIINPTINNNISLPTIPPIEPFKLYKKTAKNSSSTNLSARINEFKNKQTDNYKKGEFCEDVPKIFANFNVKEYFDEDSKIALFLKTFLLFKKEYKNLCKADDKYENAPWKITECKIFLKTVYNNYSNETAYNKAISLFNKFFKVSKTEELNLNDFITSCSKNNNKFMFSLLKNLINEKGNTTGWYNETVYKKSSNNKLPQYNGVIELYNPEYVRTNKEYNNAEKNSAGYMVACYYNNKGIKTLEDDNFNFIGKKKSKKDNRSNKNNDNKEIGNENQNKKNDNESQERGMICNKIITYFVNNTKYLRCFRDTLNSSYSNEISPEIKIINEIQETLETKLKEIKKIEIIKSLQKNQRYKNPSLNKIPKFQILYNDEKVKNLLFLLFDQLSKTQDLSFQERIKLFTKLELLEILIENTEGILNKKPKILRICNCQKHEAKSCHFKPAFMQHKKKVFDKNPLYFITQLLYIDYEYIKEEKESSQFMKTLRKIGLENKKLKKETKKSKKTKKKKKKDARKKTIKKEAQIKFNNDDNNEEKESDLPKIEMNETRTFKKYKKGFFDDEKYYLNKNKNKYKYNVTINMEGLSNYCINRLGRGWKPLSFFKIIEKRGEKVKQKVEYKDRPTYIKIRKLVTDNILDIYFHSVDFISASWSFTQAFINPNTLFTIDNKEFEYNSKLANRIKEIYKYGKETKIIASASPTIFCIKDSYFNFKNLRQAYPLNGQKHIALVKVDSEIDVVCHNKELFHLIEDKNINISKIINEHNNTKNINNKDNNLEKVIYTELEKLYFQIIRDLKALYSDIKKDEWNRNNNNKKYIFTFILSSKNFNDLKILNEIINQCNAYLIQDMDITNPKKLDIYLLCPNDNKIYSKNHYSQLNENNQHKPFININIDKYKKTNISINF